MKISRLLPLLLAVLLSVQLGCSSETPEEKREREMKESAEKIGEGFKEMGENIAKTTEESVNEAMKQANEALKNLNNGEQIEPVNFRELKKILPEELNGMERTESSGQTSGAFGFKVSTAEGVYEKDNKRIEVKITDTGGFSAAIMGMAGWASMEVDKETKDGYERTTTRNGYKVYEKYNSKSRSADFSVLVGNRFVVELDGRNVEPDDMEDAMDDLDFDDLKDAG